MIIWPEYIDINDWAANLIADYPNEYLPMLDDPDKWQDWASVVAGTGIFAKKEIPSPLSFESGTRTEEFDNWQEWAKTVYNLMMNSGDR